MRSYYNEIDPYAAQWLCNLIDAGHIAPGVVDTRSIEDVRPSDLEGFTQRHFFAGIGVWSYALRRAGWPDDRPVWTGSCPCQPFSAAGKGAGFDDERHLWPAWHHLIKECKPASVIGEQVASKDAEPWLDLVQDDLEAMGYAFGAIPFPAAGVGAPHIRDRLYWVADAYGRNASAERQQRRREHGLLTQSGGARIVGNADSERAGRISGSVHGACGTLKSEGCGNRQHGADDAGAPSAASFWADADWIACRDGKARPVEPGTFPLAHGATARVGRLRAYGNAICAPAAQAFIESVMETAHA
jgi:DNA (cytosine-5)-methyltransferase 1